jgi:hypothetical protein
MTAPDQQLKSIIHSASSLRSYKERHALREVSRQGLSEQFTAGVQYVHSGALGLKLKVVFMAGSMEGAPELRACVGEMSWISGFQIQK